MVWLVKILVFAWLLVFFSHWFADVVFLMLRFACVRHQLCGFWGGGGAAIYP